jgi:uncharacterized protein YlzI (FlbEa/FlbD family)
MLLVICRYKEDISWIENKGIEHIIYDKSVGENVGRESEAFCRYIIENYDNIPESVVFLQGDPFSHCPDLWQRLEDYNGGISFLTNLTATDDINGRPYSPNLGLLKYLKTYIPQIDITDSTNFTFSAGAQYIVPRENIINKSIDFWKKIHHSHWEEEKTPWIIERIWPLIWELNFN